jgi:hypothetical protein
VAWIVGDGGTVLYSSNSGVTWGAQDPATGTTNLNAVSAFDAYTAWACGDEGTITYYKYIPPPPSPPPNPPPVVRCCTTCMASALE